MAQGLLIYPLMEKLLFGIPFIFLLCTQASFGFNPFKGDFRISSSSGAHVYEMSSCIEGEKVEGCRGIILKDVVLIGPLGKKKTVPNLFLRNMRDDYSGKPASKECLESYVDKMNKYLGHSSIMKDFSKKPGLMWRDPEDNSQFSIPVFMNNTSVDHNGSAYGIPVEGKSPGFSLYEPGGKNCSFSISMDDHLGDGFKPEPIITEKIEVTPLPPIKDEVSVVFTNDNIQKEQPKEEVVIDESIATQDVPCEKDPLEGTEVLRQETILLTEQWSEIKPDVYDEKTLMNADITYSFMNANIADATITLETRNGEIDYISMKGVYDVLGMSGEVAYGFTIDQIKRGESLSFYADYNSQPILKITPSKGFNEKEGGAIRFQFWDGKKFKDLDGHLAKDASGEFKLYIRDVQPANEVSYLRVNVRGLTPGGMRINQYEVK